MGNTSDWMNFTWSWWPLNFYCLKDLFWMERSNGEIPKPYLQREGFGCTAQGIMAREYLRLLQIGIRQCSIPLRCKNNGINQNSSKETVELFRCDDRVLDYYILLDSLRRHFIDIHRFLLPCIISDLHISITSPRTALAREGTAYLRVEPRMVLSMLPEMSLVRKCVKVR